MTQEEMNAAMAAFRARGGKITSAAKGKPDPACSASATIVAKAKARDRAMTNCRRDIADQRFD